MVLKHGLPVRRYVDAAECQCQVCKEDSQAIKKSKDYINVREWRKACKTKWGMKKKESLKAVGGYVRGSHDSQISRSISGG